eukprot:gnl/MRDRNA2_/MRDRNA2_77908_c0_seq1.p1 gnl/MRDRNA2_/MRDRNA2_77908_c0~~gnl/MRDRNA2_/MRDRNA2_77908_c0_seq1.p1  ORF type:complete len:259 (+),score=59.66 gnl/MRDRNA2_/MRDRNA2_77908_c0_seq1:17-793(+)
MSLLVQPASASATVVCPNKFEGVFVDMIDGDKLEVSISGSSLTVKPSDDAKKWVVNTELDQKTCSTTVDFSKQVPDAPPGELTATFWISSAETGTLTAKKAEFEFTDPSGKLAPAGFPLTRWVQLGIDGRDKSEACPKELQYIFKDIQDGDLKLVLVRGTSMLIAPFSPRPGQVFTPKWVATGTMDFKSCSAMIDFNVPGKSSPPPVPLKATLLSSQTIVDKKTEVEFTDPSGTLASKDFPLNHWVQLVGQIGLKLPV